MTSSVVPETRPFLEKSRADLKERASAAARSAETNRARLESSTPAERADPTREAPEWTGPVRGRIRESLRSRGGLVPMPVQRDPTLAELAPARETPDPVREVHDPTRAEPAPTRARRAPVRETHDRARAELVPMPVGAARRVPTSHARFRPRR